MSIRNNGFNLHFHGNIGMRSLRNYLYLRTRENDIQHQRMDIGHPRLPVHSFLIEQQLYQALFRLQPRLVAVFSLTII